MEKEDEEIGLKNVSDDDFKDEIDEDEDDDEDDAKKENNSKNLNKFTKKDDLPIEKVFGDFGNNLETKRKF